MKLLLLFVIFLIGCSSDNIAGGATTESTNGYIEFAVVDIAGTPIVGCEVKLQRRNYLPAVGSTQSLVAAVSTAEGIVRLDSLPDDSLTILIDSDTVGIRFEIESDGISSDTIDTVVLQQKGTLTGTVSRDSIDSESELFIQLKGTDIWLTADSNGIFSVQLPAGNWPFAVLSSKTSDGTSHFEGIEVAPGEQADAGVLYLPAGNTSQKNAIEFVLRQNGIDSLTADSVAIFNGSVIEKLDLSGMGLTGNLTVLGSCQIRDLDLSENSLTVIDDFIGWGIPQMRRLNLAGNQLDSIPFSFRTLKELTYCNLSDNALSSLPDDLTILTPDTLLVGGNQLNSVSPAVEAWLDQYAESNWRELQQ